MSNPQTKPPESPAPSPRKTTPFPFSTQSLLELCWGMTMVVSHEEPQQVLGKAFNDQFVQMFADIEKNDPVNADFVRNLTMTLSGTARSMAFVRAVHVQYLDFNADRLTRRRQTLEKVADFASFSGSGLFAKLGSFVGFGSVADFVKGLNYPQDDIPLFVMGGVIGAFALTFIVNRYVSHTDDTWITDVTYKQDKYWKEHFKPDMVDELFNIYLAIKSLIQRFYPEAKDAIMSQDDLLRLTDEEVKDIIRSKILPPDGLNWPPYTFPAQAPAAPKPSAPAATSGGTGSKAS